MRASSYLYVVLATLVGGGATYAILDALGKKQTTLIFVMSAIVGCQVGAWRMHADARLPRASVGARLALGAVVSATNLALGLGLHLAFQPFAYPDISIGIAGVGSLLFPFAVVNTALKALNQKSAADR
ncbi:MAG: hypothetical protein AAF928_04940 [Myxococcota bacterium]